MTFLPENYYVFNKSESFVINIMLFITYFLCFILFLKYLS